MQVGLTLNRLVSMFSAHFVTTAQRAQNNQFQSTESKYRVLLRE